MGRAEPGGEVERGRERDDPRPLLAPGGVEPGEPRPDQLLDQLRREVVGDGTKLVGRSRPGRPLHLQQEGPPCLEREGLPVLVPEGGPGPIPGPGVVPEEVQGLRRVAVRIVICHATGLSTRHGKVGSPRASVPDRSGLPLPRIAPWIRPSILKDGAGGVECPSGFRGPAYPEADRGGAHR